jgi:hypothetical protein
MNPGGPIEEAGATVRSFIEALKGNPAVFALIIANFATLIFIFYILVKGAEFRDKMLAQENEFAKHVTELLSRCVVPPQRGVFNLDEIPLPRSRPISEPNRQ